MVTGTPSGSIASPLFSGVRGETVWKFLKALNLRALGHENGPKEARFAFLCSPIDRSGSPLAIFQTVSGRVLLGNSDARKVPATAIIKGGISATICYKLVIRLLHTTTYGVRFGD